MVFSFGCWGQVGLFDCASRVILKLLYVVDFTHFYDVLPDSEPEPDQSNHGEHVLIVIEKAAHGSRHELFVNLAANVPRLKELGLLYVGPVHFIKLPTVAIRVHDATILNLWLDVLHMRQTPQTG